MLTVRNGDFRKLFSYNKYQKQNGTRTIIPTQQIITTRKQLPSGTEEELFRYMKQYGAECEWGRFPEMKTKYNIT